MILLKEYAETLKVHFKILDKKLTFVVCFDSLVDIASSAVPEDEFVIKITNFFQDF